MYHPTDWITDTTAFVTPVMEHVLEGCSYMTYLSLSLSLSLSVSLSFSIPRYFINPSLFLLFFSFIHYPYSSLSMSAYQSSLSLSLSLSLFFLSLSHIYTEEYLPYMLQHLNQNS